MRRGNMMDYLMSRDRRMLPRDYARERRENEMGMDYARSRRRNSRGQYMRDSRYEPYMEEDGHYGMGRGYYGSYGNTPFYVREEEMYGDRDYRRDRNYEKDYGYERDYGEGKLSKRDIDEWVEDLMKQLATDEKEMFKIDKVVKKAEELGIKFDKFTENELYVTTLMFLTDYKSTLGKSNIDMYIRLAKDFLCDEDAGVRYGEKLAAYYDFIVCA